MGYSQTASGRPHATLWAAGSFADLGTLGGTDSVALGINNKEQVVGYSDISACCSQHAFLYSAGNMIDLNDFLKASGSDWTLQRANAINDAGQIVGYAYNSSLGEGHGFLLSPVEPGPRARNLRDAPGWPWPARIRNSAQEAIRSGLLVSLGRLHTDPASAGYFCD